MPGGIRLGAVSHVSEAADPDFERVELDRPLLTADEVAALLAVSRSSVYEYARRQVDPLPSLLIGRHRRFDRRTVERWLAAQLSVRP
jgi:excisionase family DNA binding protein